VLSKFYEQIMANPWGLIGLLGARLVDADRPRRARALYAALIDGIRRDGWQRSQCLSPGTWLFDSSGARQCDCHARRA